VVRVAILLATLLALSGVGRGGSDVVTCDALVAALSTALDQASEFILSVSLEQGGREVAYERSHVTRGADGATTTTTLERRGLQRPSGTGGASGGPTPSWTLPCDDHDLAVDATGRAWLTLRDPEPDAPVSEWALQFDLHDGRWQPVALSAPFTVRVLFLPVRGRFVTTFSDWRFDDVP